MNRRPPRFGYARIGNDSEGLADRPWAWHKPQLWHDPDPTTRGDDDQPSAPRPHRLAGDKELGHRFVTVTHDGSTLSAIGALLRMMGKPGPTLEGEGPPR